MQLVPLPAMRPLQPSSVHIFRSAFHTDILYSLRPALCTWNNILRRSSGDTTVLETAPATPPAMKEATTGSAMAFLSWLSRESPEGGSGPGCARGVNWAFSTAWAMCGVRTGAAWLALWFGAAMALVLGEAVPLSSPVVIRQFAPRLTPGFQKK